MEYVKVSLLDKNNEVQYGLNWGQREKRDPNQSYLQLTPEIYRGNFFPPKGKFFIVNTDDNKTLILTRAQKDLGCALQTPENNALLGSYIRTRLGLDSGKEITKQDIINSGITFFSFSKIDDMHYNLYFGEAKDLNDAKDMSGNDPLQQIIFGAPGTGKSHSISINSTITEDNSTRTTFHPDSDYSTFVGCYKPIKKSRFNKPLIAAEDLIEQASFISGVANQVQFICDNAESIVVAADEKGVTTNKLIWDSFKWHNETYFVSILKSILAERKNIADGEISYEFTPQAFTNAYVKAWLNPDIPQYLIIEEINRGNCAQIFGDIFQLLDRDETGYSSYKISPDKDLENYLCEQFSGTNIEDSAIKCGAKMQLPPNLYIWATMNTSDQSLFPIDSAFKRRWDWKYIPIDYTDRGHNIVVGNLQYIWSDFLDKVNQNIEAVTQSEDKKLGYWFAARKEKMEISLDRFVSKVIFYLWNDIFKDYSHSGNSIFKENFAKFHNFFDNNGQPNKEVIIHFLDNLGVSLRPSSTILDETVQPSDDNPSE